MKNLAVIPPGDENALVGEAIGLADMSTPQKGAAITGLLNLESKHENLSGICAALIGIVLLEVKRDLPHGSFKGFLKKHFSKTKRSAQRYMRLGRYCLESKSDSTVAFAPSGKKASSAIALLTQDLATSLKELELFQLDLSHPVVSYVAQWVNGRGSYQLMLDYPSETGGHHPRKGAQLSAAEKLAAEKEEARRRWKETCDTVQGFFYDNQHTLIEKNHRLMMKSLFSQAKRTLEGTRD